jgi:hypothetical protein
LWWRRLFSRYHCACSHSHRHNTCTFSRLLPINSYLEPTTSHLLLFTTLHSNCPSFLLTSLRFPLILPSFKDTKFVFLAPRRKVASARLEPPFVYRPLRAPPTDLTTKQTRLTKFSVDRFHIFLDRVLVLGTSSWRPFRSLPFSWLSASFSLSPPPPQLAPLRLLRARPTGLHLSLVRVPWPTEVPLAIKSSVMFKTLALRATVCSPPFAAASGVNEKLQEPLMILLQSTPRSLLAVAAVKAVIRLP